MALPGPKQEPLAALVRHEGLRQPRQGAAILCGIAWPSLGAAEVDGAEAGVDSTRMVGPNSGRMTTSRKLPESLERMRSNLGREVMMTS